MRGRTAQPGFSSRQGRLIGGIWCAAVATTVALGGCGLAAAGSHVQVSQVVPAAPSPGQASPTAPPDAPTADAMSAVASALNALAARTATPDSEALRAAFDSAGFDPAAVEVSVDVTPTGLEVDAMTAAVPVGVSCIFGHIREGVVSVTELPVLSGGRCFVGDQR
jgi:hypothetical protein